MQATQYRLNQSLQRPVQKYFVAILILIANMFSYDSPAAGRILYDNFENGIASWWDLTGYGQCVKVASAHDGGGAAVGSGFAECNYDEANPVNGSPRYTSLEKGGWPATNEMFIRFWIRADADFTNTEFNAKLWRYGSDFHSDCIEHVGGLWLACQNYAANEQLFAPHLYPGSFGDRAWHKYEMYIRYGANGKIRHWIDDGCPNGPCETPDGVTVTQDGGNYSGIKLMSNASCIDSGGAVINCPSSSNANNHIYIDNVEIFTTNGTGASGSMADGTIAQTGSDQTSGSTSTSGSALAPPNPPIPQ